MKRNAILISLGLVLMGIASPPVFAADFGYTPGSIKDFGGVPVPAPVPVPIYNAGWYFRFDAGIGLMNDSSGSETGALYGLDDSPGTTGPVPFGNSPAFFNDDFDTFSSFGAGVGYYWTKRIRTDVTVETRTNGNFIIDADYAYIQHALADPTDPTTYGPVTPQTQVNVDVQDRTSLRGGFTLFNLYYDLFTHSGFTPYVGAGIGFSFNEINRSNVTTTTTCNLVTDPDCDSPVGRASETYAADEKKHSMALAAAFSAGFSYAFSSAAALDFNYRYLYLDESEVGLTLNGVPSIVSIGETSEHQLRAGVRFNVF